MKKHLLICAGLMIGGCQTEEVKLNNEIKGTWQVDKVVYVSNYDGRDSAVGYQAKGLVTFEEYSSSRPSYINYNLGDWSADCKTTYTYDKNNNQLFINPLVSPYIDSDKIQISFTGRSTFDRLNNDQLILNTTAIPLRLKNQALKAKIYLSK